MGHRTKSLDQAYDTVRSILAEVNSAYNDGYVSQYYKEELYHFRCWLDDVYNRLPTFSDESKWEQNRLIKILKKPDVTTVEK